MTEKNLIDEPSIRSPSNINCVTADIDRLGTIIPFSAEVAQTFIFWEYYYFIHSRYYLAHDLWFCRFSASVTRVLSEKAIFFQVKIDQCTYALKFGRMASVGINGLQKALGPEPSKRCHFFNFEILYIWNILNLTNSSKAVM